MSKQQSSLAKQAEMLHKNAENAPSIKEDEKIIGQVSGKDIWQGFLHKKVKVPLILAAKNVGKVEITNLEVILGRAELLLEDREMDMTAFNKLVTMIFDKAFLNEDKKPVEDNRPTNLADVGEEILLDTVISIIQHLSLANLEVAESAIKTQIMIERSEGALIVNE